MKKRILSSKLMLTYKGETKSLAEWAKEYNQLTTTIRYRLKLGWSMYKALNQPSKNESWKDKL